MVAPIPGASYAGVTYLGSLPSSVYAAIGPNSNVMLRDLWGRPSPYLDMYVLFVYR
jgi:hypothetical protein